MAKMIPDQPIRINNEVTEGELRVFEILRKQLLDDCITFYNLRISNYYSDFVIVHPFLGFIVLEVKDWSIDYILKSDVNFFKLRNGRQELNPIHQAVAYMREIENLLKTESNLVNNSGKYKNKLIFPRGHGVVFTNISRSEFTSSKHCKSIEQEFIIYKDDLNRIENSFDTQYLIELLKKMYTAKFSFTPLTSEQIELIKIILNKESSSENVEIEVENDSYVVNNSVNQPKNEEIKVDSEPQFTTSSKPDQKINNQDVRHTVPPVEIHADIQQPEIKPIKDTVIQKPIKNRRKHSRIIIVILIISIIITAIHEFNIPVDAFISNIKANLTASIQGFSNSFINDKKAFMTFKVKDKYTYIFIDDKLNNQIHFEAKELKKDSIVEFYKDKTVVVTYPNGKTKEIQFDSDLLYIEVANAHTEVYFEDKEITQGKRIGYFRYKYSTNEILKGWKG